MEEVLITIKELQRGYRFIVGNHFDKCIRGDYYPSIPECMTGALNEIVHKNKVKPIFKFELK